MTNTGVGRRIQSGFTLIELMVVVVVVAVLSSLAYPSYQEFVAKAKRTEGKAALLDAAQALERHFTNYNTYPSSLSTAGVRTYSGDSAALPSVRLAFATNSW